MPPYANTRLSNSTQQQSSFATEIELFSIEAAKAAKQIFEELGTTCAFSTRQSNNGDESPHGGDEPYETIDDVNSVMQLGDSLSRVCWGTNAKDNRSYYIVDIGHVVTVKPKDEKNPQAESVRRVQRFLESWMKENDWKLRQAEVSQRLDRHGEVFDLLHYEDDGILRVNFAEPTDLSEDPESPYQDADPEDSPSKYVDLFGVRRTNNLRYQPVGYFINDAWYSDLRFFAPMEKLAVFYSVDQHTLIQHRKRNVLANDPRGLTLYWPVREEMNYAKKLLSNLMRVSSFQAAFGAIRTINAAHGADQVRSWLESQQTGTGSSGQNETFDHPAASVVTIPATIKYDFPETGAGASNHIEVLVNLLRACSSGMKLPEFMLTANVSEGNFASTLVSEGPFHKAMRFEQYRMVDEDARILNQALKYAADSGLHDLTDEDIENTVIHIKPPRVQTRNRQEDFDVNKDLYDRGELSGKTLLAEEGKERESEQAQRALELKAELELPKGSSLMGKASSEPGPIAASKADSMKEKGVMKKDPEKT